MSISRVHPAPLGLPSPPDPTKVSVAKLALMQNWSGASRKNTASHEPLQSVRRSAAFVAFGLPCSTWNRPAKAPRRARF